MEIKLHEISVRDVFDGYENNEETGQVVAYGGKLNVRPAYQREFVYDDKKKVAVMNSILHQFPLNVMYWSEKTVHMKCWTDSSAQFPSAIGWTTATLSLQIQHPLSHLITHIPHRKSLNEFLTTS